MQESDDHKNFLPLPKVFLQTFFSRSSRSTRLFLAKSLLSTSAPAPPPPPPSNRYYAYSDICDVTV